MAATLLRSVVLYHHPLSYNSQLARLVLAERSIPWQGHVVDIGPRHENFEPWYVKLNPGAAVPTLSIGGEVVTDPMHIAKVLDREFPGPKLFPEDPEESQQVDAWIELQQEFPEEELTLQDAAGAQGRLTEPDIQSHIAFLKRCADEHAELRDAYEAQIQKAEEDLRTVSDPTALVQLRKRVDYMLDRLNERVREHEWLVAERYTAADTAWTVLLARLELLKLDGLWENGAREPVQRYYSRVKERPSFHQAKLYTRPTPALIAAGLLRAAWSRLRGIAPLR